MVLKPINRVTMCGILFLMSSLCAGCLNRSSGTEEYILEETEEEAAAEEKDTAETDLEFTDKAMCTVYVCGAVNTPGVYSLPEGSRIYEALAAAGGMCAGADQLFLNQAEVILDGQQIYVPTEEEAEAFSSQAAVRIKQSEDDGRVNLNTATREELMALPGIGEAKADSILNYREEHGGFKTIEELMQIPGIKKGVFEKLKDSITVT